MVIDASVWISYFISGDRFHDQTVAWFDALSTGEPLIAPTILLPEVAGAVARRSHDSDLGLSTARQVLTITPLRLVPVDEQLTFLAAEVASALPIKGADALYIATAQTEGVPLVTWDVEQRARGRLIVPTFSPREMQEP